MKTSTQRQPSPGAMRGAPRRDGRFPESQLLLTRKPLTKKNIATPSRLASSQKNHAPTGSSPARSSRWNACAKDRSAGQHAMEVVGSGERVVESPALGNASKCWRLTPAGKQCYRHRRSGSSAERRRASVRFAAVCTASSAGVEVPPLTATRRHHDLALPPCSVANALIVARIASRIQSIAARRSASLCSSARDASERCWSCNAPGTSGAR